MKVLFLHVPKFNNYYKPIGDFIWINYMPMGLLGIADYLQRHGHEVQVVHLGVEWVENRKVKVEDILKDYPDVDAVGMSLHWHYQAYDVIQVANRIKEIRPDTFVFLGGFTASYFHDQIIEDHPSVDAVIRGDGEIPSVRLLEALDNGGLSSVPNLTWRDGTATRVNEEFYLGDSELTSSLNYTNFSLLRNARTYVDYIGLPFFFAKGFTKEKNFKMFTIRSPLMPVAIGRGCPFNCTWCGGSNVPQKKYISGRAGFIYRSQDAVIQSIKEGIAAGYRTMHTATDPEPNTQEYFVELWKRIRAEGIETNWMFECNGLPTDEFVREFKKTFPSPDSIIALSPESGNEALRIQHKGPAFTTEAFFDKMDMIDAEGISTEIFFTYGLPGENEDILQDTLDMRKQVIKRYKGVRGLRTLSIEMEPGAPWQIDPDKFGIVTDRKTFADFYKAHSGKYSSTYTTFGYYIPDYFRKPLDAARPYQDFEDRMQAIKCRKMCFLHPNPKKYGKPWQGRLMCGVASRLIKLKPRCQDIPY